MYLFVKRETAPGQMHVVFQSIHVCAFTNWLFASNHNVFQILALSNTSYSTDKNRRRWQIKYNEG